MFLGLGSSTPNLFPRRDEPALFTVRAELAHTSPPLWRRLELASDLYLDEVHDILQAVFGWDDDHLHKFGKGGKRFYDRATAHFLTPYDLEEGESGISEEQVRLDEVLERKGDRLLYLYDFGDCWELVLTLQETGPLTDATPRARCMDGRRPSPVEDCGGAPGYAFWDAVNRPDHPHHEEALADFRAHRDADEDPSYWAPVPFDRAAVNEALGRLFSEPGPAGEQRRTSGPGGGARLSGPVADLLVDASYVGEEDLLAAMVDRAGPDTPSEVDETTARRMVAPYAWLLDHAGTDGIPLTQAGYLRPASVEAAADVLGLRGTWVGKLNREDQTMPVRVLRETAQRMRLLRRYRGRLMVTPAGRKAATDPVALWAHLAERMPADEARFGRSHGGLLLLLVVAGGGDDVLAGVGRALTALGWRDSDSDDGSLSRGAVLDMVRDSHDVLSFLGALEGRGRDARPTAKGKLFARAALWNWPRDA
ncbi:plasmid pRiA4b ORF-3 family protein [Nocardiopsis sp. EMB25]|uniref:plasmid pRiA4b ORF-3 family protein n=1 Tax=Nocardiopsis sp. EMB25 TaxID=2835867 RepID=UPI0022839A13|nr:plasmid pRiA4b ORF-3 family protein [Nocardiopsis sp. EMB25]MCY9784194.1 plasmid pRiA4b ORF-3 family protein [Nocardiopsis sp. EMB25]